MTNILIPKKIAVISREGHLNMLQGVEDGLLADIAGEGIGRVSSMSLSVDLDRGRTVVDLLGEVCEGKVALRILAGADLQSLINAWLEEEAEETIEDFKSELVRADGRIFVLLVGNRR